MYCCNCSVQQITYIVTVCLFLSSQIFSKYGNILKIVTFYKNGKSFANTPPHPHTISVLPPSRSPCPNPHSSVPRPHSVSRCADCWHSQVCECNTIHTHTGCVHTCSPLIECDYTAWIELILVWMYNVLTPHLLLTGPGWSEHLQWLLHPPHWPVQTERPHCQVQQWEVKVSLSSLWWHVSHRYIEI